LLSASRKSSLNPMAYLKAHNRGRQIKGRWVKLIRNDARRTSKINQRKSGFTLLELLVVIAIIAILASFLLPALSRGKNAAQSTVCKGNLHQIDLALRLYISDFQRYPLRGGNFLGATPTMHAHWMKLLSEYGLRNLSASVSPQAAGNMHRGTWRCPSARYTARSNSNDTVYFDYGYNGSGLYSGRLGPLGLGFKALMGPEGPFLMTSVSESDVKNPADMIAFGDAATKVAPQRLDFVFDEIWRHDSPFAAAFPTIFKDANRLAANRHGGKWNVVFCDGHVEAPKLEKVFFDESSAARRRWNRDNESHFGGQ
jgi:prepilin-type N-terminal cleavage/methylation domain-containing protein/prepilin-type processing-associated H-X9-DG protein